MSDKGKVGHALIRGCLVIGLSSSCFSFLSHGKHLRMIDVKSEGALPLRLNEWLYDLSVGFRDYTTDPEADDLIKKAAESLGHVKDDSTAVDKGDKGKVAASLGHVEKGDEGKAAESLGHVDKGDKGKATESPSHVEDDSTNVGKSNKRKAVEPLSCTKDDDSKHVGKGNFENIDKGDKDKAVVPEIRISDVDADDKKAKAVKAGPTLAPYPYDPPSGEAPDKDEPANAPEKA